MLHTIELLGLFGYCSAVPRLLLCDIVAESNLLFMFKLQLTRCTYYTPSMIPKPCFAVGSLVVHSTLHSAFLLSSSYPPNYRTHCDHCLDTTSMQSDALKFFNTASLQCVTYFHELEVPCLGCGMWIAINTCLSSGSLSGSEVPALFLANTLSIRVF